MYGVVVTLLTIAAVAAACYVFWFVRQEYAERAVRQWAEKNGYRIEWMEHRFFADGGGLFGLFTSNLQTFYYVKVLDTQGRARYALLRSPSWFYPFRRVDVKWDDSRNGKP